MEAGCWKTEIFMNGCGMEIFQQAGAGFAHFDRRDAEEKITDYRRRTAPPTRRSGGIFQLNSALASCLIETFPKPPNLNISQASTHDLFCRLHKLTFNLKK